MRILTFDIEDWFHLLDNKGTKDEKEWLRFEVRIHDNVDRILNLLDEKKIKATFFCLGWIAYRYPEIIKKISAQGHEIGSHSHMHQLVYEQTKEEFQNDLQFSLRCIQDITGLKVKYYRSPGFSLTKDCLWAYDILNAEGVTVDCSVFPATRAHGGMPNIPVAEPFIFDFGSYQIKEFPMSMYRFGSTRVVFSGGGYFRILPYPIIHHLLKKSNYVMTYFHPRDFDSEQPMIKELSISRKLKSYYGLSTAFEKVTKMLDDFSFISLGDAEQQVNWETVHRIKILK